MASKFYVVWKGRETGVFTDWTTCKRHIDKFAGAQYKSFPSKAEAEAAFAKGASGAIVAATKNSSGTKSTATKGAGKSSAKAGLKTYTATEVQAQPEQVKIFTDGGCEPNPGEAGSGLALYRDNSLESLWYGLYNPQGTNNTAELNALNQALIMAQAEIDKGQSVAIFCDSQYSIQCVVQWAPGWQKKGWKKASGEIKNLELIKEMFSRHQAIKGQVAVLHVNGHVGVEGNELADRMSILAMQSKNKTFERYQQPLDLAAILAMRAG